MKMRLLIAAFALAGLLGSVHQSLAQNAYITNQGSDTVSVIDTKPNKVIATIPVGKSPYGVAVSPDGSKVYIANENLFVGNPGSVSVIDALTKKETAKIPVGIEPTGVGVSPDGSRVYVANLDNNTVSVIDKRHIR
jgi:YVTN family beta-propeller protein